MVLLRVAYTYMSTPVGLIVVMVLFLAFIETLKTQSVRLEGSVISSSYTHSSRPGVPPPLQVVTAVRQIGTTFPLFTPGFEVLLKLAPALAEDVLMVTVAGAPTPPQSR